MIDEPLNIPAIQLKHIEKCKKIGFIVVGWVGGEAVIKTANKFFRIMPDGSIELNLKQQQDKTLQLTKEFSGMYGIGYTIERQTQQAMSRKRHNKSKAMQKIVRAQNTDLLVSS